MHLTKFLSLPWRDEAEGEFDTIENQSEANPAVPRPTVSDTDLTTDPSTSQNQKSSGMRSPSPWTTRLTILSRKGGHHTRIRSIFGKIQCKGVKPIHTDVLPSLKLITEGLSDNVRHSDVSPPLPYRLARDICDFLRKKCGIFIRQKRFYFESNGWQNRSACPPLRETPRRKREGRSLNGDPTLLQAQRSAVDLTWMGC